MHIIDILARRPVPAAGVFLALTRRCPLGCAHCSTNSMMDSDQTTASLYQRFVATFTLAEHPEIVWLTGGEPLLRPDLVIELTRAAHAVGSRVVLITGCYFARPDGRVPPRLLDALLAVDHVVVSQDAFHEARVPRAYAFATMRTLVAAGQDTSFQVVGRGPDDEYLADVTVQIRREFDERVPALVVPLGAVGRASTLSGPGTAVHGDERPVATPCLMAAWPVVSYNGAIVACCQQAIVDGPAPVHLGLGSLPDTGWPEVARLVRQRATLRALRTVGPLTLAGVGAGVGAGAGAGAGTDYCGTCAGLSRSGAVGSTPPDLTTGPTFPVLESEVLRLHLAAGPLAMARRYGIGAYAHLLLLGRDPAPQRVTA